MTAPEGTCERQFTGVYELLARRLASGDDVGASVCVIKDGEVAVDLWGGLADVESGTPWTRDTLVNTYSLTKTMTTLLVLRLIDRGLLDPDTPVSHYWPEFAAAGKQHVLLRHVLGHTSGVSGWADAVTLEDLYDTEHAAGLLAEQHPWWQPGDGSGYHAISYGHLLGEVVRRVTGATLGTVLREEFTAPLGADYWLGAPSDVDDRVATLVAPPPGADYGTLDPTSVFVRTMANPLIAPAVTTTRPFLGAELGGMNGQGNARSVAELQSLVSHGGCGYLSPAVIRRVFDPQSDGTDRVLGAHTRFGLGFALPSPASMPTVPEGNVCWWTGFGGSVVVNDLDRRMTMAYVMNKMDRRLLGAANASAYVSAAYTALDSP